MIACSTAALFACVACAGAPRPPAPRTLRAEPPAVTSQPAVAAAAAPAEQQPPDLYVQCAEPASCPSAVGMLVVDDDAALEPERCTATLIAPDRVLTVSHCLSLSERHAGAPCP